MIKFVFKIIGIVVLAAIVFFAVSLWKGGDPFRWFGAQSKQAGERLQEKSEELGKEADRVKQRAESVVNATKRMKEGIRKTEDAVREFTGGKKDR